MGFMSVLRTEFAKLRRSKVTWATFAAQLFMGLVAGLFVWILGNPGMAERLGLIGQKVNFTTRGGAGDWPTLLALLVEMEGMGASIFCSIIVAYVFGREYAEGTAKNMLALGLPRRRFVAAKLVVAAAWSYALVLVLMAEGWLVGAVLGLPLFDPELLRREYSMILLLASLDFLLAPVAALIAVASGGYLAPLGYTIFTLIVGMVFTATNWARWIPWSIVPLYSGVAGPRAEEVGSGSVALLVLIFAAGAGATVLYLERADNRQ